MPRIRVLLFFILAVSLFTACKKKESSSEFTRRDYLLGTWSRMLRAYDLNDNHQLDSGETFYGPGTDTFLFNLGNDGTYQRIQTFKGMQFPAYGTWHLQDNDANLVLQPTTSTSAVDTLTFDSLSQGYLRYHKILSNSAVWYWEIFERP